MNDRIRAELHELQMGACGICGRDGDRLTLDHDHFSGLIRGLLCRRCNYREGQHPWSCPDERCGYCIWRVRPAVAWLGWTERYVPLVNPFGMNVAEYPLTQPWEPAGRARSAA